MSSFGDSFEMVPGRALHSRTIARTPSLKLDLCFQNFPWNSGKGIVVVGRYDFPQPSTLQRTNRRGIAADKKAKANGGDGEMAVSSGSCEATT